MFLIDDFLYYPSPLGSHPGEHPVGDAWVHHPERGIQPLCCAAAELVYILTSWCSICRLRRLASPLVMFVIVRTF